MNPIQSWISAVLIIFGLLNLSDLIRKRYLILLSTWMGISIFYYALLTVLGLLLFSIATFGINLFFITKGIGVSLILIGVFFVFRFILEGRKFHHLSISNENIFLYLILGIYFLLSISPVTDADSISYHLAVPLQILKNGSNHGIGHIWLHARLIGFGEYINMMGLVIGSDCLGAIIQWSGLALLIFTIKENFASKSAVLVTYALLGMPCLLFLLNTQKHQLIGDMALATSVIVFIKNHESSFNINKLIALAIPVFYAAGLKYTFYLPITMFLLAFFVYLLLQKQTKTILQLITVGMSMYLLFLFPIHLFNFINYHDPISPFGDSSNQVLNRFKNYLTSNDSFSFFQYWLPTSLSKYTTVIGLSGIVFLFGDFNSKYRRLFFTLGFSMFIVSILFSIQEVRFVLTSFIIMIFSLFYSTKIFGYHYIKMLFIFQILSNLMIVSTILVKTVPANFFKGKREECLQLMAYSYNLFKWVDSIGLPENSTIVPHLRAHLLIRQNFLPYESKYFDTLAQNSIRGQTYYLSDHYPDLPNIKIVDSTTYLIATRNYLNRESAKCYLFK